MRVACRPVMIDLVISRAGAFAYLQGELLAANAPGLDRLRLVEAPLVPEVRLHLAQDAIVWWARMEAEVGTALTPPFWATAWPGGQALARYVLDRPVTIAGRRVLDVGSGSGLVAIAAGLTGAAEVTANDVDPYALSAITLNAQANGVAVSPCADDLLDGDGGDADVVLAGDVFYSEAIAKRMAPFLHRAAARGAQVLVGDPGRAHLPRDRMTIMASYPAPAPAAPTEPQISEISVLQPR
jgi:predicted nicotinamide N-methyase